MTYINTSLTRSTKMKKVRFTHPVFIKQMTKVSSKCGMQQKSYVVIDNRKIYLMKFKKHCIQRIIPITPDLTTAIIPSAHRVNLFIQPKGGKPLHLISQDRNELNQISRIIRNIIYKMSKLSIDDFEIIGELGRGQYGQVVLCKHKKSEELVAIKIIPKENIKDEFEIVYNERNTLKVTNCPFITNFKFTFQSEKYVYIGLEYIKGECLFDRCPGSTEIDNSPSIDEIRLYIAEIALALDALHQKGIIYRDLKTENILIDSEGHIKLVDFGLSKSISEENPAKTFCGTAEYLAPEIVKRQNYGFAADWWCLGILTYELLFGATPFESSNHARMFNSICNNKHHYPSTIPESLKSFIDMLLEKNPTKRLSTLEEIKDHKFFDGIVFNNVHEKKYVPDYIPQNIEHNSCHNSKVNFDCDFLSLDDLYLKDFSDYGEYVI